MLVVLTKEDITEQSIAAVLSSNMAAATLCTNQELRKMNDTF
jgi:hypothetical protein